MSHTLSAITPTLPYRDRDPMSWFERAARAATAFGARISSAAALQSARGVVESLDTRQLDDAGIDAAALRPARPVFVVDRGLASALMNLR